VAKTMAKPQPSQVAAFPKFEDMKSVDYKTIYTSGVFGGLDPNDGRIIFFIDHWEMETVNDPLPGSAKVEKITREHLIEVHMSPTQFKSIPIRMGEHVKRYEDTFGTIPMAPKGKTPSDAMIS
jgi:hypothetical protein